MNRHHSIEKQQLVRMLEDAPFEHLTSSVHVLEEDRRDQRHELAGVSIYSNAQGWMAQINWRAVVDSDEVTLRVGDSASGERAYELRDEQRMQVSVEDEGGEPVSEDEVSAIVAQSPLAKSWEQDVVGVLKETRERQATVH
ncbi:MAG: hypothetical protein U5L11_08720 [Arhodomonas sp.]|uniref:hypothetical protein n=1 Tax=Arhodomonas sp. SL1 TaxID=3425691 RepID=UPI002AD7CF0E|nr:hypothetical protein [Arhodomonas sp.]